MNKFDEQQVKKDILEAIEFLKDMEEQKPSFNDFLLPACIHKPFRIVYPL